MNVVTAEGEWALDRLTTRLAEARRYERAGGAGPLVQGRHTAGSLRTHYANALVDLVAIVESFSEERLTRLPAVSLGNDLSTWNKRQKAWASAGIDLGVCPDWEALMGFVEARNAMQHGQGRLTGRQLNLHRQQVLDRLDAAAIQLNGDLLQVSAGDVTRCAQTCMSFITWLDTTAASV